MIVFITLNINLYSQQSNLNNNDSQTENTFESDLSYFNVVTNTDNSINQSEEYKTPSTVGFVVKTIIVLALIVAAIYGIMWFFKKKNNISKNDDDFLRKVSSITLSPGKSVEIVSLLDHAYILGVTESNINLIGEVQDKELIEAMNLNFDKKQNVKKPMNFADVLDIFMPHGPRNNVNVYQEAEQKVENINSENV